MQNGKRFINWIIGLKWRIKGIAHLDLRVTQAQANTRPLTKAK